MPNAMAAVRAYVALTKPNIIWLLLITTLPAMVLAQGGWPSTWLVLATLLGGALAAGSANAINQYADRDIDMRMARTRRRPLPRGMVTPQRALWFGIALGVISAIWMIVTVNLISSMLAVAAIGFYVIIYTYLLKRHTTQNIVIGGAAGAAPALIGWTAVTGNMWALEPIFMFLIVFWWTPPHFWALAIVLQDDYREAGVPMLPVVEGERATKVQIVLWAIMLTALTVLFAGVSGLGAIYLGTAVVGGGLFIAAAVWLLKQEGKRGAWGVYKFSTYYLAALFLAVMADTLVYA